MRRLSLIYKNKYNNAKRGQNKIKNILEIYKKGIKIYLKL